MYLSVNNLASLGTVGNHCDGNADFLFDEENVILCFLGKLVKFLDASDIALEAGEGNENGLCLLEKVSVGEISDNLAVDFGRAGL